MMNRQSINPTAQEIKDKDTAVHDFLIETAGDDPTARVLAVGLAAIHDRLGDYWIWKKAVDHGF